MKRIVILLALTFPLLLSCSEQDSIEQKTNGQQNELLTRKLKMIESFVEYHGRLKEDWLLYQELKSMIKNTNDEEQFIELIKKSKLTNENKEAALSFYKLESSSMSLFNFYLTDLYYEQIRNNYQFFDEIEPYVLIDDMNNVELILHASNSAYFPIIYLNDNKGGSFPIEFDYDNYPIKFNLDNVIPSKFNMDKNLKTDSLIFGYYSIADTTTMIKTLNIKHVKQTIYNTASMNNSLQQFCD